MVGSFLPLRMIEDAPESVADESAHERCGQCDDEYADDCGFVLVYEFHFFYLNTIQAIGWYPLPRLLKRPCSNYLGEQ